MCLPKDLEKNEYKNRCDSFQKSDFVLESDECMNFVPRIIAETKKIPTFLIVFGFSLFFFVFSLIFYRWKVFYLVNILSYIKNIIKLVKC